MGTWRTHQRQILGYPSKINFLTGQSSARENRIRERVTSEKEREGISIFTECKAARRRARRVTQKEVAQSQFDAKPAWAT